MNERITFLLAAISAELFASVILYLHAPDGPFCASSSSLLTYIGLRVPLVTLFWLLVLTVAWLYAGIRFIRPRQNLSTKLRLLFGLALVGLVIDNLVSLYQFESSTGSTTAATSSASLLVGLAQRTSLYAIAFSAVVLLFYLLSRMQKPTVTPPPRFGRE